MKPRSTVIRRIVVSLSLLGAALVVWLGFAYLGLVWPFSAWQPTLRATLDERDNTPVSSLAFSPDGKTLASGNLRVGKIKLWDVATGENTVTLKGHDGDVNSVAFSPDGETLASGVAVSGGGMAINLWDMTSRKQRATFKGDGVRSVAFSRDGTTLASASMDETIKLWDLASCKNAATLKAGGIVAVAFSSDGKTLASASLDATVKLWDLASAKKDPVFEWKIGPWGTASSVAFSPDGTALAAGGATDMMSLSDGAGSINLWNLANRKERASFWAGRHCGGVASVAFSPDGRILASGSGEGKVQFWDASTGKLKATVINRPGVESVTFSPNGMILASGGRYGRINLWDVPTIK